MFAAVAGLLLATTYPPDPFAADYQVPKLREVGTTAGQVRLMGTGAVMYGADGLLGPSLGLGGSGTFELMTFAFLGFRTTVEATVPPSGGFPWMVAARTGPCLHLLPYHRVDLSAYIEGGAAGFGLFGRAAAAAPMVTPGGSLDIWLDPVLFLRFDGHIDWSVNNFGSAGQTYVQVVGGIGLGVGF